MTASPERQSFLTYLNLSDAYERKARFVPGVLAVMFLLPVAIVFGIPLAEWLTLLATGVGFGVVIAIGISHVASAMGNRLQRKLWPRWPHDSPTHRWLHPADSSCSAQQKQRWYAAIKRLTGLDITSLSHEDPQLDLVINDAVREIRARLWGSPHAKRLDIHNADYGFARNFTGLRPIWLLNALLSAAGCWVAWLTLDASLMWPIIATGVAVLGLFLAFGVLPQYVRVRADYYAESFFAAMLELDRAAAQMSPSPDPTATKT